MRSSLSFLFSRRLCCEVPLRSPGDLTVVLSRVVPADCAGSYRSVAHMRARSFIAAGPAVERDIKERIRLVAGEAAFVITVSIEMELPATFVSLDL